MPQVISEAVALRAPSDATRFRARIIQGDLWSKNGNYYSGAVLKEAAADRVFGASTPIYIDHPGFNEAMDRPERSIRDLAGKLTTDAVFESDGLYADIELYPHIAPTVAAMAGDIGLSIRASAEVSKGEAVGRRGNIVERFTEAASVDLVTKPSAGGKLTALLEAARHLAEVADDNEPSEQSDQPTEPTPDIDAAPIPPPTVPSAPAGQPTTESSQEMNMPQLEEARLRELTEAEGKVTTLEAERDTAKSRADLAEATLGIHRAATERALDSLAESTLPLKLVKRIVREATAVLPVKDGGLDEAAFDAKVKESREDFEALVTEVGGRVSGFGASAPAGQVAESARPTINPWGRSLSAVKEA